ncbi:hypothetical protein SNEBB_000393 [Seison nebaliae]|nr:hypothetical protein SNEBB_000393 [Seison nebaliae]
MININEIKYPVRMKGQIIHGYKRGSTELNCPTANFDENVNLPKDFPYGVYYGRAQFESKNDKKSYECVMSIGANIFYNLKKRSVEAHLIDRESRESFYGEILIVDIMGRLRDMENYNTLEELKEAIANDIKNAVNEIQKGKDFSLD